MPRLTVLIVRRLAGNYSRNRIGKFQNPGAPWRPRKIVMVADGIIQSAVVYFAASLGLLIYVILGLPQPLPNWIIGGMPSFIVGFHHRFLLLAATHVCDRASLPRRSSFGSI